MRAALAAAHYESHRLIYLSAAIACTWAFNAVARLAGTGIPFSVFAIVVLGITAFVPVFGFLGWVGAMRSDRRWHLFDEPVVAAAVFALILPIVMFLSALLEVYLLHA